MVLYLLGSFGGYLRRTRPGDPRLDQLASSPERRLFQVLATLPGRHSVRQLGGQEDAELLDAVTLRFEGLGLPECEVVGPNDEHLVIESRLVRKNTTYEVPFVPASAGTYRVEDRDGVVVARLITR